MGDDEEKREQARLIVDEFMRRIYIEIGKGLFKKLFWVVIIGLIAVGVSMGVVKIPKIS